VVITPDAYAAWQEIAQRIAPWLMAIGVSLDEVRTMEEQLELLDDGETLRLYALLPGNRGEVSLNIPREQWAWAPTATN
jgi:hypothetical protein